MPLNNPSAEEIMAAHLTNYSKQFLQYLGRNAPDLYRARQPTTGAEAQ
jgi:hypothetical protein